MNLANRLTLLRMFLVPIFLLFIAIQEIPYGTIIASFIFIAAALTDSLDGYIARSRNQVTKFGKFMDPLADKLLVTTALICLVELLLIPSWAAVIMIAREFAVSGLRTIAASDGNVIAASIWGKIKTVFQVIAIILYLFKISLQNSSEIGLNLLSNSFIKSFFHIVPDIFFYSALLITIISGVDYFIKNTRTLKLK